MKGNEKSAGYYDEVFKKREIFKVSYKDSPYWVHWTQVIKFIGKDKAKKILDVGCGPGQLADYLKDEGYTNYTGFDFSKEAVKRAKIIVPDFAFFVGDALRSESYKLEYDVILCLEVFEHLNSDYKVIGNIDKGKQVIFSVPNFWDPSHVRRFITFRQIKKRYYKLLDIKSIVRIGNIYVCNAIRSDFRPNLLQRYLKSREIITWKSFKNRILSYLVFLKDLR